jgi:DNA-binding XRE family transcriptional regulator
MTKFEALLREVDMNGAQLARRLDVTVAAVSAWCRGKCKPKSELWREIAKQLGVSLDRVVKCFI